MKSLLGALPLAVFVSRAVAQGPGGWLPSCSWNDCMGSWDGASCDQQSGWDCICGNSTAISQINTCVATSCTNATDQESIYGAIAQLCANAGQTVTNSQQATFSATSGGSLLPSATGGWGPGGDWDSSSWASWASQVSTAIGSAPSGWGPGGNWGNNWGGPNGGGPGGPGGPGGHNGGNGPWGGPWGTKASGIACSGTASWTTWTAGWGPYSSWTGLWSGCSSTTATPEPATVTTTITTNGQASVITGTTFGIQALSTSSGSASGSAAAGSAASLIETSKVLTISGVFAATVFGLMVGL